MAISIIVRLNLNWLSINIYGEGSVRLGVKLLLLVVLGLLLVRRNLSVLLIHLYLMHGCTIALSLHVLSRPTVTHSPSSSTPIRIHMLSSMTILKLLID